MPCFFCGKRVSLVRQLTDADFCSDEHRKRYQELTRLALDRLLDAGQRLAPPEVHPETESIPQWQAESVAAEPEVVPEPRPAPPPQPSPQPEPEEFERPWRPPEPELTPVYEMPPAEEGEPVPPEAFYFARLECEPQPVAFPPQVAQIEAFEVSFNAPTTNVPPSRIGLRESLFVRERPLRAAPRPMPECSEPSGGNGFHGTARFESLTSAPDSAVRLSIHQLPPQQSIAFGQRPAAMRASVHAATEAVGRAIPRAALPRLHSARERVAQVRLAALAPSTMPRGTGKVARQPGEIGFLPFPATVYVGWLARGLPENALHLSGLRPMSASTVNVPATRAFAPAAVFHAVPSCSCHTAIRSRAAVVGKEFADLPLPRAVQRALRLVEAPAGRFARTTVLPAFRFEPAAEIEIDGIPPEAPQMPVEAPRARAIAAARRSATMADFATDRVALPRMAETAPAFAVSAADFEFLGHRAGAAPRPGAIKRVAVDAAPWPAPLAAPPPFFATRRPAVSAPAATSLMPLGLPAVARGAALEAVPGPTAAMAAFEPIAPRSAAIAAVRLNLTPATYAPTSATLPADRTPRGTVTIGAQFRRPQGLIEVPALAAGPHAGRLAEGEPRRGIVPQRPMAMVFAPRSEGAIAFQLETSTPVCSVRFEERLSAATYSPTPFPAARKGSRSSASRSLAFAGQLASLPEFHAAVAALGIPSAEPATHMPASVAGRLSASMTPLALAIHGPADVRLLDVALKPPAMAGAIEQLPLAEITQPAPRTRSAAWRILPECQIDCRTFFPPAPAPVSPTHVLPAGTDFPLAACRATAKPPAVETASCSMPVPPAALIEWTARAATPRVLSVPPAIRGQAARATIRSTAQPCGWLAPASAAPVIGSESALLRPEALRSGSIERGPYLEAAPRRPAAAAALGAVSPFSARDASLPAERTIAAREALEMTAAATALPQCKAGAAPAIHAIGIGFRQRHSLLPEIRLDPTLARIAAARRLGECPASPLPAPAWRDMAKPRAAAAADVPVPLTESFFKAAGRIQPVGPFRLGAAELEPLARRTAWPFKSQRRDAEIVGFEISAPIEPASTCVKARHTLEVAPPAAGKGRSPAGVPNPATASVVAVSTHPVELAGQRTLVFAHPVAWGPFSAAAIVAPNRAASGVPAGWEAYARESAVIEYASIQSRASGARWPGAASFRFAHEPESPARAGSAAKAGAHIFVEFAVPAVREPKLSGGQTGLGSAPAAGIPAPALRQDAASTQKSVNLTPAVRPHRHPSRLPVFHTTVEKARMPFGVFNVVEFEDWEDERTMKCGEPYPASQTGPWIPPSQFSPRARNGLGGSELASVGAGPCPGMETPAGIYGELPFAIEIAVLASGAELEKMDFESIAETYSPRWRSALKSASGLFRGMMMICCLVALSTLMTGCSGGGKSLRESIQSRAVIHLEHDFSKGLDGWSGAGDWTGSWPRNPAGFVGAGQLAIYRPSQQLSDYRFEFLGQIAGRTMGWVFRAADLQNYYATQLKITRPGQLPQVALVRYQVIGGQETARVEIPLQVSLQNGQPYRIEEDVAGSAFTTSVDGEVVDSWSDDRLRTGAVGFFGSPEDRPNLYWMKVTNNDDFWGKVCGMLAPNN